MKKGIELKTELRVEQFYGLSALLQEWEQQPDEVQIREHDYILKLKARIRSVKNYIMHRATADAKL